MTAPGHGNDDAAVRDRLVQLASGPPGCGCPRRPPGREVSPPARLVPGRPATAPPVNAGDQPPGSLPVPAVAASRYTVEHLLLGRDPAEVGDEHRADRDQCRQAPPRQRVTRPHGQRTRIARVADERIGPRVDERLGVADTKRPGVAGAQDPGGPHPQRDSAGGQRGAHPPEPQRETPDPQGRGARLSSHRERNGGADGPCGAPVGVPRLEAARLATLPQPPLQEEETGDHTGRGQSGKPGPSSRRTVAALDTHQSWPHGAVTRNRLGMSRFCVSIEMNEPNCGWMSSPSAPAWTSPVSPRSSVPKSQYACMPTWSSAGPACSRRTTRLDLELMAMTLRFWSRARSLMLARSSVAPARFQTLTWCSSRSVFDRSKDSWSPSSWSGPNPRARSPLGANSSRTTGFSCLALSRWPWRSRRRDSNP